MSRCGRGSFAKRERLIVNIFHPSPFTLHPSLFLRKERDLSGSAVQFGAGNIGRGFLAQLFTESGLEVVFIDVAAPLVDALNARGSYPLHIVGDAPETLTIRNV